MKYDIEIGGATYEIDAPDETSLRDAVNKLRLQVGTEQSIGAAQSGAEARSNAPAMTDADRMQAYGFPSANLFNPETDEGKLNIGAAAAVPATLAAPAIGTFLASPAGGAVTGALPGIREGDPIAAAKGAAYGAATGAGLGQIGKLLPFLLRMKSAGQAAPVVAEAADQSKSLIVQQLRQIASRDDASYLAAKQIAKEMGEEGKQIWDAVKTARPRHRAGLNR